MWSQKSRFGMKLFLQQIKPPKQLICLDIGSHQTGVSISCQDLKNTYYLKCIDSSKKKDQLVNNVNIIIKGNKNIKGVLIGRLNQPAMNSKRIDDIIVKFVNEMANKKITIPYTFVDQSFTTQEAKKKLMDIEEAFRNWGHLHNEKQLQDGLAAMNIMNRFLTYYNTK